MADKGNRIGVGHAGQQPIENKTALCEVASLQNLVTLAAQGEMVADIQAPRLPKAPLLQPQLQQRQWLQKSKNFSGTAKKDEGGSGRRQEGGEAEGGDVDAGIRAREDLRVEVLVMLFYKKPLSF